MDPSLESFQPLLTQANPAPTGAEPGTPAHAAHEQLPSGLGVLVRAGASLRRSLLVSLAFLAVSSAELAVLLLLPNPEVDVVWGEPSRAPLVEVP